MPQACVRLLEYFDRINWSIPAVGCIVIFIFQHIILDFYLGMYLRDTHFLWFCGDFLGLIMLVFTLKLSATALKTRREVDALMTYRFNWLTWVVISSLLSAKVVLIFFNFSHRLDEQATLFFGPNTLRTTVLLSSCIFLLFLSCQHDAPVASGRQAFIKLLTARAVIDCMDAVDLLEVLFDPDHASFLHLATKDAILATASFDFLLPAFSLAVLNKYHYGHAPAVTSRVYLYRMWLMLAANLPNLLVRLAVFYGYHTLISLFVLKNVMLVVIGVHEYQELRNEDTAQHETAARVRVSGRPRAVGGSVSSTTYGSTRAFEYSESDSQGS